MAEKMSNKELIDSYYKLQLEYFKVRSEYQNAARSLCDVEVIEALMDAEKAMRKKLELMKQELVQRAIDANSGFPI